MPLSAPCVVKAQEEDVDVQGQQDDEQHSESPDVTDRNSDDMESNDECESPMQEQHDEKRDEDMPPSTMVCL